MMENVGEIIGLDDMAISGGHFVIAHGEPGQISLFNTVAEGALPNNEQGVYTCRIPDSTNTLRDVNVGIYIAGFNSELY